MPRFEEPLDDESEEVANLEDPDESDMDDDDDPALIPCPHCSAEISEDAERCPVCGDYISKETARRRVPIWVVIVVIIMLIVGVMWQFR